MTVKAGFKFELVHFPWQSEYIVRDRLGQDVLAIRDLPHRANLIWIQMEWPRLADETREIINRRPALTWPALTASLLVIASRVRCLDEDHITFRSPPYYGYYGGSEHRITRIPPGGPATCLTSWGELCPDLRPGGRAVGGICLHMIAAFLQRQAIIKQLPKPPIPPLPVQDHTAALPADYPRGRSRLFKV